MARNQKQSAAPPEGFVPARILFDREPPSVSWVDLGDALYDEPFFDQTVERVSSDPGSAQITTGLDAIAAFASEHPSVRPAGFIFHMSRCGSTLVSNAFKRIEACVVVSEAAPINALLWRSLGGELLRGLIHALGARRRGRERYLVIKFSSWNVLSLAAVRQAFPHVPCVFVYRDPVEVMVSNLETNSGWMHTRHQPDDAALLFGWTGAEVARMSAEEYCARALGKFCDVAADAADRNLLLLNYEEINLRSLLKLAGRLGVQATEAETARIAQSLTVYSKDLRQTISYSDDRERKRGMASPAVREMARLWAAPAYSRLAATGRDWLL